MPHRFPTLSTSEENKRWGFFFFLVTAIKIIIMFCFQCCILDFDLVAKFNYAHQ